MRGGGWVVHQSYLDALVAVGVVVDDGQTLLEACGAQSHDAADQLGHRDDHLHHRHLHDNTWTIKCDDLHHRHLHGVVPKPSEEFTCITDTFITTPEPSNVITCITDTFITTPDPSNVITCITDTFITTPELLIWSPASQTPSSQHLNYWLDHLHHRHLHNNTWTIECDHLPHRHLHNNTWPIKCDHLHHRHLHNNTWPIECDNLHHRHLHHNTTAIQQLHTHNLTKFTTVAP